ncbi:MAG: hypothetical protein KGL39_17245 [Patescibacteria group bacterium]|nr:hypothetical protein [Patescibacteria group bacterium]
MAIKAPPPDQQQGSPFVPPEPAQPYVFEEFDGMNTDVLRPGVDDKQAAWIDGFMPTARMNLRTLYGIGSSLWTAPAGGFISFFDFANISANPLMIGVHSDGGVWQVNTDTKVATRILNDGSILSPSRTQMGISQWGSTYVLIVAEQANGYFIWDGTLAYYAGTLGPVVTLTNIGSGYTSAPTVMANGGHGSGAAFDATVANGVVTGVSVTNPGSGYLATDKVALSFSGGQTTGSGAVLTATVAAASGTGATFAVTMGHAATWYIQSVAVVTGGSGYPSNATLSVSGGDLYETPVLTPVVVGGAIVSVTVKYPGIYTSSTAPTVTAVGTGHYYVDTVTISNGGSNYSGSAIASCYNGGTPTTQATLSIVVTAGVVTDITIVDGGIYGSNTPPDVAVSDIAVTAIATVTLMPFGIGGTAIETYAGRVWIANGSTLTFSAPGSVIDFSSASGGGNVTSSDSFLRVAYTALKQTNGFLYLIGDSSVNYISGVQTSGTPPVTTFTNQNADPEVGTPWPGTVDVFNRNILFANSFGAHVSYGAAVTKISEPLDGIYNSLPNFGGLIPSAAKAIIFGKKVWILLLPIVDPITFQRTNKLFMWDGKRWWASEQDIQLQYIQCQEINSVITAYGTDGTNVYPLFALPSTAFTKTVQSKLWATPGGYREVKSVGRFWGVLQLYSLNSPTLTVSINSESTANMHTITPVAKAAVWKTAGSVVMVWTTTGGATMIWGVSGLSVIAPQAVAQNGALVGMTIETTCADMAIVSLAMDSQIAGGRW